jgi:dTDP-4-dehydrorhamnose 3,5-epimerase
VVVTDLREDSPTRLRWVRVELSAENRRVLYVPEDFAQGYQTSPTKQSSSAKCRANMSRLQPGAYAGTIRHSRSNGRPPQTDHLGSRPDLAPAAELANLVKRGSLGRTSRTAEELH